MTKTLNNVLNHKLAVIKSDKIEAIAVACNERWVKQFFQAHTPEENAACDILLTACKALKKIAGMAEDSLRFEGLKKLVAATSKAIDIVSPDTDKHAEWLNLVFVQSLLIALPVVEQSKKASVTVPVQPTPIVTPSVTPTPIQPRQASLKPLFKDCVNGVLLAICTVFALMHSDNQAQLMFGVIAFVLLILLVKSMHKHSVDAATVIEAWYARRAYKRAVYQRALRMYKKQIMVKRMRAMVKIGLTTFIVLTISSNVIYFFNNYKLADVFFTLQQDVLYVMLVCVASFVAMRFINTKEVK